MITRWKSALPLSLFILIPIVTALPMRAGWSAESGHVVVPADVRPVSTGQCSAGKKDRVTVHRESGRLLVDVKHATGIGGTHLHTPPGGWPRNVLVRLHGFADLESFRASTADASLNCERIRPEGIPPRLACHSGAAELHAIRQRPGYFEITLPPMLFAGDGPVELQWVDQWR